MTTLALYPQQSTSKKAKLQEATALYDSLKSEFERDGDQRNVNKCLQTLSKLKLMLADLSFMPTVADIATDQETLLARSVLEIACLLAVETRDLSGFERQIAELKSYYSLDNVDFQQSPYTHHLLGLDLLCLLAQNRLADFHAALEVLPRDILRSSPYVRHPIQFEQFLMEGSYNKIFAARESMPAENYKFFIDMLLSTVRTEIASCIEKAYDRLSFIDAARLLFLSTPQELQEIATKRGWNCVMASNEIVFRAGTSNKADSAQSVVAVDEIGKNLLGYARSLETII